MKLNTSSKIAKFFVESLGSLTSDDQGSKKLRRFCFAESFKEASKKLFTRYNIDSEFHSQENNQICYNCKIIVAKGVYTGGTLVRVIKVTDYK